MFRIIISVFCLSTAVLCQGNDIIAHWNFKGGRTFSTNGRFEGILRGKTVIEAETLHLPSSSEYDPGGLMMRNIYPELTPQGAFRLEVKFKLNSEQIEDNKKRMMLWDSKYVIVTKNAQAEKSSHSGFALMLSRAGKNRWIPCVYLGYGTTSLAVSGNPVLLNDGKFHTIQFDYAPGMVTLKVDGKLNAENGIAAPGKLAPAIFRTVIGDRSRKNYWGFVGEIAEVILSELTIDPMVASPAGRTGFIRLEKDPKLIIQLFNNTGTALANQQVDFQIKEAPEIKIAPQVLDLPSGVTLTHIQLDSRLNPGTYNLEATIGENKANMSFFVIGERGDYYPVVLWGGGNSSLIRSVGFTHALVYLSAGAPDPDNVVKTRSGMKYIDDFLKAGVYSIDRFTYYRYPQRQYPRMQRNGKPYPRVNLEASNPEVPPILVKRAEETALAYGGHPAYEANLINSEVRDGSNPSFGGAEEKAFREYAGYDIPAEVNSRWAPDFRSIPDFPAGQVIPDDYPLLVYYKWFWKTGDGWNNLHGMISKALHKNRNHYFWTFNDPAIRVPPLWGSGGDVDCIESWSYTNPDPLKVGMATDELLAMASGNPSQKIMKMIQVFWYRNQSAPAGRKVDKPPSWLAKEEKARFIAISNDFLKIGTWSMLSRRLDGIMYHGYSSLVEDTGHGYRYTNPELKVAFKELITKVVEPLGNTLKRIPEPRPQIAMLESFASTLFARRHSTFGWGRSWWADFHLALQWAHYQPVIIYDESIAKGILDNVDILVLPGVEVLAESTYKAIIEFQRKGGMVVADNFLLPGIIPDISINAVTRDFNDAAKSKAALQQIGASIREQLEPHFKSPFNADNQDIVLRMRSWENTDYLFAINDKRTYGDYVGQWRMIMEKGLPNNGVITVNRPVGAIYDLVSNTEVKFKSSSQSCEIALNFEPGEGRLLMLMERPLGEMAITASATARIGEKFPVDIAISDNTGQAPKALIPVMVQLIAPNGEPAPGSNSFCAENGKLRVEFIPSINAEKGNWQINVKNLANGQNITKTISMQVFSPKQ